MEISVEQLKQQFSDFEAATNEARARSEKARDYRDLKQWTPEEIATLQARGQAPLVIPKIPAKVDFLVGLERQQRTDPRAYPRTEKHEKAADAATDALRYVADNTEFNLIASDVFEQACLVEGYAAAIIEPTLKRDKVEIDINFIPFDRFYFDPYSRRRDFKDATYLGFAVWLDLEVAKERYPEKADQIAELSAKSIEGTFDDKPRWLDRNRKRVMICQHYFRHKGVWHVAHFTDGLFLLDPQPSPLMDEHGEPECPIEALSGYIDREGNRYALTHSLMGLQDEINHRRSKALHMLSVRQLWYEEGAVEDERRTVNQLKKPDAAVKFLPNALRDGSARIEGMSDLASGQTMLLQEAKAEIDARGASSILQGIADKNLSGTAMRQVQSTAMLEIGPLMDAHRHWKKRVYRQIWNRIKQFWDEERWIRVTDDEDNLKWVGLNRPVTLGEQMQQEYGEIPPEFAGDPQLNQVVEVENEVAELDVDIIIEDAPDTITVQQEQFEIIAQLAQQYGPQEVPFEVLLRLSSLRNKEQVLEKLKGDPQMMQMQQQIAEIQRQLQMRQEEAQTAKIEAEAADKVASAREREAKATQTELENELLIMQPQPVTSVAI